MPDSIHTENRRKFKTGYRGWHGNSYPVATISSGRCELPDIDLH